MRFLITAGPTREYLDPVRFLSNASSGKTGFALAREAVRRGHSAVLVTGPTFLEDPPGVTVIRVVSAQDMAEAVLRNFPHCDVLIGTAAVCDWRPAHRAEKKLPKEMGPPSLTLQPTPDVLSLAGAKKAHQKIIGFALASEQDHKRALRKLRAKNMDWVVLNGPENLGSDAGTYHIIAADGTARSVGRLTKAHLASLLISLAVEGPQAPAQ